jgi:subtilase family serine protease
MRRYALLGLFAALSISMLGAMPGVSSAAAPDTPPGLSNRPTCPAAANGDARCFARVVTDANGKPLAGATPLSTAKTPADIQSAYGLPTTATVPPSGPVVAIVDAYDHIRAEQDLAVFRTQYNLPACTTANGCFKKVNQRGGTTPPRADAGWATEIALDIDAVSAACPNCRILLVEADSPSFTNLGIAVKYAATQQLMKPVAAISNSYGGPESSGAGALSDYNNPGIAVTASTGDNGYGVSSPASSQYVIAVGGTRLVKTSGVWTESVWSGAGSGCSAYVAKSFQGAEVPCTKRGTADVAAVADPNTGLSVYDSVRYQGQSGWQQYGGTSLSAPIIAAVYALGTNHGAAYPVTYTYGNRSGLYDVTSGTNGTCTTIMCKGATGYDGPTGLGSPRGLSSF